MIMYIQNQVYLISFVYVGVGVTLRYNHAQKAMLLSSINVVATSATHKVVGKIMSCAQKKFSSKPMGPIAGIGNLPDHCGIVMACCSLERPTAAYILSPNVHRMGPVRRSALAAFARKALEPTMY